MEAVTCDNSSIYAVRRQSKDQLIVHRFSHTGTLIDALRITLPEVTQSFPEGKWPVIWQVFPANEQLAIVLASYSYTRAENLGGLLEQRLNYTIQLPK